MLAQSISMACCYSPKSLYSYDNVHVPLGQRTSQNQFQSDQILVWAPDTKVLLKANGRITSKLCTHDKNVEIIRPLIQF
jgi:hypothetical protein